MKTEPKFANPEEYKSLLLERFDQRLSIYSACVKGGTFNRQNGDLLKALKDLVSASDDIFEFREQEYKRESMLRNFEHNTQAQATQPAP